MSCGLALGWLAGAHAQTTAPSNGRITEAIQLQTTRPATATDFRVEQAPGPLRGYAFLQQKLLPNGVPQISVNLRPDSTIPPANQWSWHVDESDATIATATQLTWYAQASCPDALTSLKVSGPAGTLTQNPLYNPIYGYFKTQSFSAATIKNVCTKWANANKCDILSPGEGCELYEEFSLEGGVPPAGNADRLLLRATCLSGSVANQYYAPLLIVRCNRGT